VFIDTSATHSFISFSCEERLNLVLSLMLRGMAYEICKHTFGLSGLQAYAWFMKFASFCLANVISKHTLGL